LSFLRERHPRVSLRPLRGRSASLVAQVKAGEIDAAVVAMPDKGGTDRLAWWPLARRPLVVIAPPGSTEASPTALLRRHDWIRYDRLTVTGAHAARHVLSLVPDKRGALELDSMPAIIAMVSGGLGVAALHLLDPALVQTYPTRVIALGKTAPILTIALVCRKSSAGDRALQAVREGLELQMRQEPGTVPRS
jgi:DNA-binding transcriptional LysR family regulator